MATTRTARPFRWFTPMLGLLLGGYMFFGRPFAYLNVPGLHCSSGIWFWPIVLTSNRGFSDRGAVLADQVVAAANAPPRRRLGPKQGAAYALSLDPP